MVRRAVALALVALAIGAQPAAAAGTSATAYRGAAYYRALLATRPPPYWNGGGVWPPANVVVHTPGPAVATRPAPRPAPPKTLRVPDGFLEAARNATSSGPLWVKTERGFRLEVSEGRRQPR